MKTTLGMISVLVASVLCLPAVAAAQGTVKTFDQLNTRIKTGNIVRVTDTEGQEVKGKLTELRDGSITVDGGVPTTFEAHRVRLIQHGTKSYWRPVLLGMLIGGVVGGAMAFTNYEVGLDTLAVSAAIGLGVGAGVGAGIRAARPPRWNDVYRAPGASAGARMLVAPMITPRAKGVVLSLSF
jgi:hypothetical protein